MIRQVVTALTLWVALVAAPGVRAADLPVDADTFVVEEAREWQVAVATYLWGAGLSGQVGVGGLPPVDVGLSFRDIVSNLDFAAFSTTDVRFRRLVGFADVQYVKITIEEPSPFGLAADTFKLRSETFSAMVAGGYQLIEAERGFLDAVAGARVYSVSNRLSFTGGLPVPAREASETWVDPIVGLKGRFDLDERFHLLSWGFVGGFGVSSDINWDVLGAVGFSPRENVSLILGYRASGVDFSRDGFIYDTIQQGPVIGGVIRF